MGWAISDIGQDSTQPTNSQHLRSMKHNLGAQNPAHYTADFLEERRVERGSAWWASLKGWERPSSIRWTLELFKDNTGEISERRAGVRYAWYRWRAGIVFLENCHGDCKIRKKKKMHIIHQLALVWKVVNKALTSLSFEKLVKIFRTIFSPSLQNDGVGHSAEASRMYSWVQTLLIVWIPPYNQPVEVLPIFAKKTFFHCFGLIFINL